LLKAVGIKTAGFGENRRAMGGNVVKNAMMRVRGY
jgi:hypothetical protein